MISTSTQRRKREAARHRRPADGRRQRACKTADDDVLRRAPLQPQRVDADIEEDRKGEQRCQPRELTNRPMMRDRADRKRPAEAQRVAARDRPIGMGRVAVRVISAIDVGIIGHVERAGRARADRDAEQRREGRDRIDMPGATTMPARAREDDKRHHARLQQREEVADRRGRELTRERAAIAMMQCVLT